MFNLKEVKCVTFNKKGAWLYDPLTTLSDITTFLLKDREPSSIPWIDYLSDFGYIKS